MPGLEAAWFDRALGLLENILTFISGICLSLMMVWITADATGRYFFKSPIPGTSEFNEEYLMVILVFFAISYTFTQGGHVRVTLFLRFFPTKIIRWLAVIGDTLGLAFFLLLTISSFEVALDAARMHVLSNSVLKYPMAPAMFSVPIGSAALTLRLLQSLLENIGIIKRSKHQQVEFAEI